MEISVIIPTYNSEDHIDKCISSLLNQSVLPEEIIIVDGRSEDNTRKIIESFNNPTINFITNDEGRTPGSNRNLGAKEAKYEYLIFIDSDCIADKDLIKNYKRDFEKNKIIAGNVKILNPGKISNYAYLRQKLLMPYKSQIIENIFFWSMNFGITKDEFIEFVDTYFAEDLVFFTELKKKNKKIYFSIDTVVKHPYTDSPIEYFKKQLSYSRGYLENMDKIDSLSKDENRKRFNQLLQKNKEDLRYLIDNKVSFDKDKLYKIGGTPDPNYLAHDLLTLAIIISIYEFKGGKLEEEYEEIISFYLPKK